MAKNIEINIQTSTGYESLYPKIDLTNNQGTALPLSSTSGNLASSRLSAGTLSGSFTFGSVVSGVTPTSTNHLATKGYVDNFSGYGVEVIKWEGTYQSTSGSSTSNSASIVTLNFNQKTNKTGKFLLLTGTSYTGDVNSIRGTHQYVVTSSFIDIVNEKMYEPYISYITEAGSNSNYYLNRVQSGGVWPNVEGNISNNGFTIRVPYYNMYMVEYLGILFYN